jgi:hypothetical protein
VSFYIKVLSQQGNNSSASVGEISFGAHVETFPLLTTKWAVSDYLRQWRLAAAAIAEGSVQRCMFVTDIQPVQDSASLSYWALFRT